MFYGVVMCCYYYCTLNFAPQDKQLSGNEAKLKELSEQNAKLQRSHKAVSSQVDKYRQSSETLKRKCEGLEAQLVSLRKVCVHAKVSL